MFPKIPAYLVIPILFVAFANVSCSQQDVKKPPEAKRPIIKIEPVKKPHVKPVKNVRNNSFAKRLSSAARQRTRSRVVYDGRYIRIGYPWGDVPANIGVCTDVVIRSYRKLGIDLQSQVHKDMKGSFSAYPNYRKWGLSKPDTNIDHRRVYNLKVFFKRHGQSLPITRNPNHYQPGDLVTWELAPGIGHIGIVVEQRSKQDPKRHLIVHNIAQGPKMEDILFRFRISGHYRYSGKMRYYRPAYTAPRAVKKRTNNRSGSIFIPPELR
jgi:uncharacterized protein YijF (DUF1287 family)